MESNSEQKYVEPVKIQTLQNDVWVTLLGTESQQAEVLVAKS